jgi:hypothetical protein
MENQQNNTSEHNTDGAGGSQNSESQVVFYDSYDHGFTNGLLKVPKEHFEEFIRENGQKRLAKIGLASLLNSIERNSIEFKQTSERLLHLKNQVSSCEFEIILGKERQNDLNKRTAEEKERFDHIQKERSHLIIEYNWLNVGIFIAMGLAFLIADFTITLDVLHKGLDMAKTMAIPLAIAVSGITFVLKPTIDRLFEKPYLRDEKRKKHGLLISVSIISLFVLGLLGYFREEYFRSDKANQAVNREISAINNEIDSKKETISSLKRQGRVPEAQTLQGQIQDLEAKVENKNQQKAKNNYDLGSNTALFWIFVLSNMLFAVAGAICLSIAFPAADRLRRKRRLRKQQSWFSASLNQLANELTTLQNIIKDHQITRNQAENEIQLLADLPTLEAQRQDLLTKLSATRIEAADHDIKAEAALYREAYERGNICEFGEKLIFSPSQIGNAIKRGGSRPIMRRPTQNNGSVSNNSFDEGKESEGGDRYLHQQIRSLIEYNHRRKKHLLNGEED